MTTESLADAESRMKKSEQALSKDLSSIRTGRANPGLVEDILVEYGGATYPMNQLAQISVADARLLTIQPWDPGSIPDIEKAIQTSDIGIMPGNDGKLIRLPIPALTEERRKDLVRAVKKRVEEGKVADLVVLSADFLTVPEEQIEAMQVMMTMVGGKIVFSRS